MVNRHPALRLLLVVSAWAFAMPGFAQTSPVANGDAPDAYGPEPAHIAYIDGAVVVTRQGRAEAAAINIPLLSGDQLKTQDGRAEVLFGDGSVLDFDNFTTVDFLSDELVRLTEGRLRVTIGGRDRVSYRVDTPSGAVRIEWPGEYRISLRSEGDVELVAVRGMATLVNEQGDTTVRAGERAFATNGMAPSYAQAYNSAAWDEFDRWAEDRRDERTGAASAEYLPDEVRSYAADFDRYGAWQYDGSYGYVWYPRVAVGWRPYYYGYWNYYNPWGWTWISYHPWGWPTHHYGRWGFRAGAWFWIPSRHWAPAHVYWAGASDYVGWCPLGWDNRPIFSINIGYTRYGYRGYDPYRAWTVVPRGRFGHDGDVSRYAVPRRQLDHAVPRWYVSGMTAPIRPAAASRDVAPIYSAGRATSRRGGAWSSPAGPARSSRVMPGAAGSAGERRFAVPRDSRVTAPATRVPRATPPPAAGVIGPSTSRRQPVYRVPGSQPAERPVTPRERAVTRSRAPYRDAGPGGPEPRYQTESNGRGASRSGSRGAPAGSAPREVGAPRGVPSGGIYGQRGVPRDDGTRGAYVPRAMPRGGGVYAPPPQRSEPPASYRRAPSRGPEGGSGVFAPRVPSSGRSYGQPSSSPRSYGAPRSASPPSRSAPSAGRPGGGGDRAAPRGGSAPPRSSSGGHSRPRPQ